MPSSSPANVATGLDGSSEIYSQLTTITMTQLTNQIAPPPGLELLAAGKVRQLYAGPDNTVLIVASDRISAFDVVFEQNIPGKGEILTGLSKFWFEQTAGLVNSHYLSDQPGRLLKLLGDEEYQRLSTRSMLARRARPLPIEAIVRQYLEGSAWGEYQRTGTVAGQSCPPGLKRYDCLPQPIFTPSSKAEVGGKDININEEQARELIGASCYDAVREASLRLFAHASEFARTRGLILCDTKFEFGLDANDELLLIDELLTPDSSRYWLCVDHVHGHPVPLDKQFLRNWLTDQGFSGTPPAPILTHEFTGKLLQLYRLLAQLLTGSTGV